MKLKEFKEPIDKKDLGSVILNGLLSGILGGILAGLLDYLFGLINIPLTIGLIIIVYLIIYRVRKSFYSYHILYSVLGLLFLIIGLFFSYFAYISIYYITAVEEYRIYILLARPSFWLGFVKEPISGILVGVETGSALHIIAGLFNIIIYVWAFIFTFRSIRTRRR